MSIESTDVVTVSDLRKSYGDVHVLEEFSFSIPEGEVFGILGPNGVGKTTLIKILTGQEDPDGGSVTVNGITPWEDEVAVRNGIGVLPEKQSPPSHFTPRAFFSYVGLVRDIPEDELVSQVEKWAEYLGFTEQLDTIASSLSRGQQQKVMLTQALLHNPDIVFIDEPVANLDPLMQEQVKSFIRDFAEDGNTVILSTHNTDFAAELCTSILSITNDGAEYLNKDNPTANDLIEHFEETW